MIEVRLFATFREGRQKIIMMNPENKSTVLDVITELSIPSAELAICLINGFHSKVGDVVKDNDVLALFPPVGGG